VGTPHGGVIERRYAVRPDGVVAWRSRHLTPAPERELENVLSRILCLPNIVALTGGDHAERCI
jgi:hypothetical protein